MWTSKQLHQVLLRTAWICVGIPLLSLQLKCQGKKAAPNTELKGLRFQSLLPLRLEEGKIISYEKLLYVYESADDIAVQYPVYNQKSRITVNKEGEIINDELQEFSTVYKYVLYSRGDSLGRYYNSPGDNKPSLIKVDSFLRSNGMYNTEKLFRRIKDSLSLVSSHWDDDGSVLTNTYIPTPGTKLQISDSIVLVFSKHLNAYWFSLPGSELRAKDIKISRLELIMNPDLSNEEEILRYRRELIFELTVSTEFLGDIKTLLKDFHNRKLRKQ